MACTVFKRSSSGLTLIQAGSLGMVSIKRPAWRKWLQMRNFLKNWPRSSLGLRYKIPLLAEGPSVQAALQAERHEAVY
jgi:hypothetical protein